MWLWFIASTLGAVEMANRVSIVVKPAAANSWEEKMIKDDNNNNYYSKLCLKLNKTALVNDSHLQTDFQSFWVHCPGVGASFSAPIGPFSCQSFANGHSVSFSVVFPMFFTSVDFELFLNLFEWRLSIVFSWQHWLTCRGGVIFALELMLPQARWRLRSWNCHSERFQSFVNPRRPTMPLLTGGASPPVGTSPLLFQQFELHWCGELGSWGVVGAITYAVERPRSCSFSKPLQMTSLPISDFRLSIFYL